MGGLSHLYQYKPFFPRSPALRTRPQPPGRFILQEALTARGSALAGRKAGGKGGHWDAEVGRQRVEEVVERMHRGVVQGVADQLLA